MFIIVSGLAKTVRHTHNLIRIRDLLGSKRTLGFILGYFSSPWRFYERQPILGDRCCWRDV